MRHSAERERPSGERGQHLRRDPHRRRRRSAPSSGSSRRCAAGARGTGTAPFPAASPALSSAWIAHAVDWASGSRPFVSEKPPEGVWKPRRAATARRIGAPPTPAARSAWIAAAVSFESGLPPRDHGKPPPFACAARIACTSARGGCSPTARSASTDQIVSFTRTSGTVASQPGRRPSSTVSPRASSAITRSARSPSVAALAGALRRNSAAAPAPRSEPPAATSPSAAHAVSAASGVRPCSAKPPLWALPAREEGGRLRGEAPSPPLPLRPSTSAATMIASRLTPTPPRCSSGRRGGRGRAAAPGPAASASTKLPSACATLKANPAASTVTSAAHVWG